MVHMCRIHIFSVSVPFNVVGCPAAEPSEERFAVGSAGVSRHECLFETVPILGATLTVTGLTEILELLAIAVPAVAVFVVLAGVFSTECFTASDARHLSL
jgi:hypothetical protein